MYTLPNSPTIIRVFLTIVRRHSVSWVTTPKEVPATFALRARRRYSISLHRLDSQKWILPVFLLVISAIFAEENTLYARCRDVTGSSITGTLGRQSLAAIIAAGNMPQSADARCPAPIEMNSWQLSSEESHG